MTNALMSIDVLPQEVIGYIVEYFASPTGFASLDKLALVSKTLRNEVNHVVHKLHAAVYGNTSEIPYRRKLFELHRIYMHDTSILIMYRRPAYSMPGLRSIALYLERRQPSLALQLVINDVTVSDEVIYNLILDMLDNDYTFAYPIIASFIPEMQE